MNGIIDVGGGQRAVFACGVFDYLLEHQIYLDYCMGVSAGAANCVSYVARQAGRNLDFYTGYNLEPMAIGLLAMRKTGSLINLDYIYGTVSNSTGKRPLDFEAYSRSETDFNCVATDIETGEAVYFRKNDLKKDNYQVLSASSCDPLTCKPYPIGGKLYFDGYVSDPLPVEKALEDGCDRIIVVLTHPKDHFRSGDDDAKYAKKLKQYPAISDKLGRGAQIYNDKLRTCLRLEQEGEALILYPKKNHLQVLEKDEKLIRTLYDEGYEAGSAVKAFLK